MPRKSQLAIQRTADRRLAEADRGAERFVDLCIDWHSDRYPHLARFGGRWDRVSFEWAPGEPPAARKVKMHEGQLAAAIWFYEWLGVYLGDAARAGDAIFSGLLHGGRRGGKTTLGVDCLDAFGVSVPESISWVVTPNDRMFDEPLAYIEKSMPVEWYTSRGAPHWDFELVNGSKITMRSGFSAPKLKHGRTDFVLIQEGQQITQQALNTASAGTIDAGGLTLITANSPDVGDKGTWIADMIAETERGIRKHSKYFFLNPEQNSYIDQARLRAMREQMTEHEYAVQILGELRLPPDAVLYAWDKGPNGNERPAPASITQLRNDEIVELSANTMRDVTREFSLHHEGFDLTDLFAVDIQNYPWHALIRARAFENPHYPGDMEQALLWGVGEVYLDKGDEVMLAQEAKQLVYRGERPDPANSLVVMDASGDWQQAERDLTRQRARYQGAGSMDMFRSEGFAHVVPPDRNMTGNPRILDRCRAANSRICTASGRRLVFLDPELCPRTVASVQKWRSKNGMPDRRGVAAHGGDALTYLIWRFFPRRARGGTSEEVNTPRRGPRNDRLGGMP